MNGLNPKDSSFGRIQRRSVYAGVLRAITGCVIAFCFLLSGGRFSIAGEGVSLILNRTPYAAVIENISTLPSDSGSNPTAAGQPVLAGYSIVVLRCEAGYQVRCRMEHLGVLDLPLSPGSVIAIGPPPRNGQQLAEISILSLNSSAHGWSRELFNPWSDGVCRGYRCARWASREKPHRIPVKVLVDDDEAGTPALWQARLSRRIDDANQILLPFCGLFLDVISFETWVSDAEVTDFETGFREFVSRVDPSPAVLAIGFSSQWATLSSPSPLGVSAGPLSRHILVREYGRQITESERLETLLHELGHYFGAAHVPDGNSVMRPHLEKRPARDRYFSIGFDPVNTLILNAVVDELRAGHTEFTDLSPEAARLLRACYGLIQTADPTDQTASRLASLLPLPSDDAPESPPAGSVGGEQAEAAPPVPARPEMAAKQPGADRSDPGSKGETPGAMPSPGTDSQPPPVPSPNTVNEASAPGQTVDRLVDSGQDRVAPSDGAVVENAVAGARLIVREVVDSWRPPRPEVIPRGQPVGDCILEGLVRRAAEVSVGLRVKDEQDRRGAFLLAIGVLVDDTGLLRNTPGLEDVFRRIESSEERKQRLSRLGIPTIFAREDWAQHFCVSAALVHLLGAGSARSLGLAKEWRDSQGDSGWSFADLAADLAGIRFGEAVLSSEVPLETVRTHFQVVDFVPPLSGYEEDIPFSQFVTSYGGLFGQRTRAMIADIEKAIGALPAYQPSSQKAYP